MKVIHLHTNEKRLIKKALNKNRAAQQTIYERYAPKMLSVCRMYIKDTHFAEDVMLKAFLKVFTHLKTFKNEGSFEGWIRKIMVREAISFLRSHKKFQFSEDVEYSKSVLLADSFQPDSEIDYIQTEIDKLPEGYKIVFVMYVVEGYKHKEIAELLNITEGTSKSQLAKARKLLQDRLRNHVKEGNADE
ncbi:RNA polymerase sigma factor [Mesonia maritima]|uniref:RNA polymerase sigma-70 factor (ECF subfamily) n=1 Tax=Mesonia maritima TaxID=1793873 RepID=A0ABU1K9X7_9FLAO|nr:RNA polymerase sigma factor [Mesonia maritima]MDR6302091.1 RNA polymerase sigma-70 factor (ECF subfamily) [Mesonia maritima]